MKKYQKVILVGQDNLCESIMAEAILKKLLEDKPIEVISRGMVVLFPEPVNPKAVVTLSQNQLEASKKYSEELSKDDIIPDTLILTLTEAQTQKVFNRFDPDCDVMPLREFADLEGDIPTAGGDLEEYQDSFEHLDLLMKVTAQKLLETVNPTRNEQMASEIQGAVEDVVERVYSDTLKKTLGRRREAQLSRQEKQVREEQMTAEYLEIVEKTQAREAAREAAKESELSEYKQRFNAIKARLAKEEEEMWGSGSSWDDSDDFGEDFH